MEPIAHVVWKGCGLRCCSAASACLRMNSKNPWLGNGFFKVEELRGRIDLVVMLAVREDGELWRGGGFEHSVPRNKRQMRLRRQGTHSLSTHRWRKPDSNLNPEFCSASIRL